MKCIRCGAKTVLDSQRYCVVCGDPLGAADAPAEDALERSGFRFFKRTVALKAEGTLRLHPGVNLSGLPAHLANCLRGVDAREIQVETNRVTFEGGLFRFVTGWNVLSAFGRGGFVIDPDARKIRYTLSFRELVATVTLFVLLLGLFARDSLVFLPIVWVWFIGGNLLIGIPRVQEFLRAAIATAPRIA